MDCFAMESTLTSFSRSSAAGSPSRSTMTLSQTRASSSASDDADNYCRAMLGSFSQGAVDHAFGANVDALGRFVKDEHLGITTQPASKYDLLLVATAKGGEDSIGLGWSDIEAVKPELGFLTLLADSEPVTASRAKPRQRRNSRVW